MDAAPALQKIAKALNQCSLDAVLVGNAAAALQGAPVTTLDFDFMFRKTPGNIQKLKGLAKALGGVILKPYYPASDLFRVVQDETGLQLDFMPRLHGIKSFESLKSRATQLSIDGFTLLVASLDDVIKSKRALGRAKDRAVLDILERTQNEKKKTV